MVRLIRSFKWAWQGLRYCLRNEKNFQLHCVLAVMAIGLSILFNISSIEWILVVGCIAAVLSFEMMNTAVEQLCNITKPSIDPTIKIIKDVSAGAVLIVAMMSLTCGAIIFIPKIVALL